MGIFIFPVGFVLILAGLIVGLLLTVWAAKVHSYSFSQDSAPFMILLLLLVLEFFGLDFLKFVIHLVAEGGALSSKEMIPTALVTLFGIGLGAVVLFALSYVYIARFLQKYISKQYLNYLVVGMVVLFIGTYYYKTKIPHIDTSTGRFLTLKGTKPQDYDLHLMLNFQSKVNACQIRLVKDYILIAESEGSAYTLRYPMSASQESCNYFLSSMTLLLHPKQNFFSTKKVDNLYVKQIVINHEKSKKYGEYDNFTELDFTCSNPSKRRGARHCTSKQKQGKESLYYSKNFMRNNPIIINFKLSEDFNKKLETLPYQHYDLSKYKNIPIGNNTSIKSRDINFTFPNVKFNSIED